MAPTNMSVLSAIFPYLSVWAPIKACRTCSLFGGHVARLGPGPLCPTTNGPSAFTSHRAGLTSLVLIANTVSMGIGGRQCYLSNMFCAQSANDHDTNSNYLGI